MNATQTRPQHAPRAQALSRWYLGLILAFGGCRAVDRSEPPPGSPAQGESAPSTPVSAPAKSAQPAALATPSAPPSAVALPSAAALPESSDARTATQPHYLIAAVGDSLTDPRSHGGGYLDYVKKRCPNVEIDNFGRGATMVVQMRRHFDEEIAKSPKAYTHLVVFGGVNDLYSDLTAFRTPTKIEADLSYMYGAAKARGMKVIALTVAPWGGFKRYFNASRSDATHAVNAWIREQPAQGKVDQVVDAFSLLSCGDSDVLCPRFFTPFKDGIHFGPAGHELLGAALYQAAFPGCS